MRSCSRWRFRGDLRATFANCIHMVGKVARGARDSGNMGFLVNYRKLTGRRLVNSVRFFPSLFLFLSPSLSIDPRICNANLSSGYNFCTGKICQFRRCLLQLGQRLGDENYGTENGSSITIKSSIFIISGYTGVTGIGKKEERFVGEGWTGHPEQKKKVAYMRQIKSRARFKSGFRAGNGV